MTRAALDHLADRVWQQITDAHHYGDGHQDAFDFLRRALYKAAGLTILTDEDYRRGAKKLSDLGAELTQLSTSDPKWEEIATEIMELNRQMSNYYMYKKDEDEIPSLVPRDG